MGIGIDYGRGQTNIDNETGIRFGVIPAGDICQAWSDSSEPDYGEPTCPKCGNSAIESTDDDCPDFDEPENEDIDVSGCGDYYCENCRRAFDGEDAFGEEALAFTLDDNEYLATQSGDDRDVFILKSPYYTRAAFCSPCAPGACYLRSPHEAGEKAYCFAADCFDDERPCPYPVYRVSDDVLIYSPAAEADDE